MEDVNERLGATYGIHDRGACAGPAERVVDDPYPEVVLYLMPCNLSEILSCLADLDPLENLGIRYCRGVSTHGGHSDLQVALKGINGKHNGLAFRSI